GRRTDRDEQVVHPLQAHLLLLGKIVANELAEVGFASHRRSSDSRRSASRARPLRVRVFTVPSGTLRNSEISLCESPLQYASSSTARSELGSSANARCTPNACHPVSARSCGPASVDATSGGSPPTSWRRARALSTIAFRATVYSQGPPGPRSDR